MSCWSCNKERDDSFVGFLCGNCCPSSYRIAVQKQEADLLKEMENSRKKRDRKAIAELSDRYIKTQLRASGLSAQLIDENTALIELKRLQIKTKRIITKLL